MGRAPKRNRTGRPSQAQAAESQADRRKAHRASISEDKII